MITKIIEATHGPDGNWGKFMLMRFDSEWAYQSQLPTRNLHPIEAALFRASPLLSKVGWSHKHLIVFDLQTGEGAIFYPGGHASYDLNQKHKIWVCPMFEPFLNWLYKQDLSDLTALPSVVTFTHEEAEFAMSGYRRKGPEIKERT
jgi:hypothetical protein